MRSGAEPRIASASPALAGLIGAAQADDLLTRIFERDAWRCRAEPQRAKALFDWARLSAALAEHRLPPSRLKLERGGSPRPAAAWRGKSGELDAQGLLGELRGGATLILDQAHEISAPLTGLCQALAADFTCWCAANLYASWGKTQGFDVHWDDHDVLVVQTEGRKRWSLYGQTRAAPVVRHDPPDHLPPPEPRETFVLEPGDALYLPRGYWHAAVGMGEPSLHLTIGLTRRTGSEFLHWLADHLLSDEAVRSDLPFEQGDAAVADRLRGLFEILGRGDGVDLASRYRRYVEASLPHRPALDFPRLGGAETRLSPGDGVRLNAGAARLEEGPRRTSLVLSWRGVRFTLDAALAGPLDALVIGQSVSMAELANATSEAQAQEFAREMIARGVFRLVPSE